MARKKENKDRSERNERVAWKIIGYIEILQSKWAEFMARMASRLSLRQQKVLYIFCGLIMSACCIHLILNGLSMQLPSTESISAPVIPQQQTLPNIRDPVSANDSIMLDRRKWEQFRQQYPALLDSAERLHRRKTK